MNDEDTRDDFLWDGRGEPDRDVAALQSELARHRWTGQLPAGPLPARAPHRRWPLALAAGLLGVAALGGAAWWLARTATPPAAARPTLYVAQALQGELSSSGAAGVQHGARLDLALGDRLQTDATSRARLAIGDIGSVEIEPDSVLRVEQPGPALAADAEHLLWLERGELTASIFAAPRLFQVGTPSGLAVDLGCIYSARVQDDGTTRLSVRLGQVSFETPQRRVTVPHGASTRAVPGRGPDTPVWDDAPEAWRAAVARLDDAVAAGAPLDAPLREVLAGGRAEDSLTLWHLLCWPAVPRSAREQVADRLEALVPAPDAAPREACLHFDAAALQAWRDVQGWSWSTSKLGAAK
jgi:FecR protein